MLKKMNLANNAEAGSVWVDYGFNGRKGGGDPASSVRLRGCLDPWNHTTRCVELHWQSGRQDLHCGSRHGCAVRAPAPGHPLRRQSHPEQHVPAGTHPVHASRRDPVSRGRGSVPDTSVITSVPGRHPGGRRWLPGTRPHSNLLRAHVAEQLPETVPALRYHLSQTVPFPPTT